MTSAIMKAKVDTYLDEVTGAATFWTTTEVYAALAHGQIAVIDAVLDVYKKRLAVNPEIEMPDTLRALVNFSGAGIAASEINLPSGFLWLVSANWDYNGSTSYPCKIINFDRQYFHHQNNTFLAATATDPIAYVGAKESDGTQSINFRPVYDTNANYEVYYLKYPTAIASGQEPTLPEGTHNAIVDYAVYALLIKDQRPEEAQVFYNKFIQEIQTIVGL